MKACASLIEQNELVQVGGLPLSTAEDGSLRVLLLTSPDTGRWVIPKGWPMKNRKPSDAAAIEALEEAGLVGRPSESPIGSYVYFKRRRGQFDPCRVDVYLLEARKQLKTWREKCQRELRWFTLDEAASVVDEPELAALLVSLKATTLPQA